MDFIHDPLVLVDTDLLENKKIFEEKFFRKSYLNKSEARICVSHLNQLLKEKSLKSHQIGCITPYVAQNTLIKTFIGK